MMNEAQWIWYGDFGMNLVNSWMQARKTFQLASVPAEALIQVTADARYRLYVNGKHVCRGPARGFQESWAYDSVDIAPFLRKGRNVIAAEVHNPGLSNFQYIHQGYAGFLLWGQVGRTSVNTGPDWRVRQAPGYRRVLTRVSMQLDFQEHFDCRKDDDRWLQTGYRDTEWKAPVCRPFGSMPWHQLEERGIPLLKEEEMKPQAIVSEASGHCARDYENAEDAVLLYLSEKKRWKISEASLRKTRSTAILQVEPTGKDQYQAYCLDFGREVVGSIELTIEGAKGSEIVDTLVCERVENAQPQFVPPHEACYASFGNRLYLRAGKNRREQYDHWGFRYLIVIVRNSTRRLSIGVNLHWVGYPLDIQSRFESSDERLNQIYRISAWTQQCCMLDAYLDCPWREQAQWWGDARVQGANTFYLSADARMLRRGIRQIGTQEVPNGLSYGHAPTIAHNCILPDFTLVWVLTHWDYYWQTGDLSLFQEMKERVVRALDYFNQAAQETGLLPYDKCYWLFLDWSPVYKDGYPTLYNLLYGMALRAASQMFRLVGDRKSSALYAERENALFSRIKSRLYDKKTGLFHGGLDWKEKPVKQVSPHVLAFAILLDLFPENHERYLRRYLLPLVRSHRKGRVIPSPYFMYYIFEALKKKGHVAEVVDCIRRWWGEMLDKGLTTTEEVWEPTLGLHSMCHAWSAHPIVHFSNILLGVWQEGAGWKQVRISPLFSEVDSAEGCVATPRGLIEVSWKKTGKGIRLSIKLPRGIQGKLVLPDAKPLAIKGRTRMMISG